ncbi:MAG: P1 family peptidase [Candidatus Aminicenantes bacterium]
MDRRKFMKTTTCLFPLISYQPLLEQLLGDDRKISRHPSSRKRIRELGIKIGTLETGPYNAITDVEGVKVGHATNIKGSGPRAVRTGVTVIIPHSGDVFEENLYASYFNLNGWGEMTGMASLESSGKLKTPVFLTGTYNVGIVYDAALKYLIKKNPQMKKNHETATPVVAECFDDFLSDTRSRQISEQDVFTAIQKASGGRVEEGVVGGGTGMSAFGFKAGIGTSSRIVLDRYTVGVLVMANTGSRHQLRINGFPVGREIKGFRYKRGEAKSIILIAATDAPFLPFQLKKMAKRVAVGLAQTGSISSTGSGDIILAFSTANKIPRNSFRTFQKIRAIDDFRITPFYQAAVEATQEAIINSLTCAHTVVGRDHNTAYGIPLDQVGQIMNKYSNTGMKKNE